MKKTIATLALAMSTTSAHALIGPGNDAPPPAQKNYCLSVFVSGNDGETYAGDCDETERNRQRRRPLKANGCAEGQAALRTTDTDVQVPACPTYVQL